MNKKQIISILLASFLGGLISLGGYKLIEKPATPATNGSSTNVKFSNFVDTSEIVVPEGLNFVTAAEITTPSVVHIRSRYEGSRNQTMNPLEEFFRQYRGEGYPQQRRPAQSSGSGVIVSSDGYIVTNNHVIEEADEITVVLSDNREYTAEVAGTDPNTDIALIKIEASELPFIEYGNSDKLKIGEWVLAVGNPFNLTSTVTAGIVSAKARSIDILRRTQYRIESFIQTDAAVNPGNSGGALVNLRGELVGINTAIATPTGSYAGYSFAVPSALVEKVVSDLKEYGVVQRALLGVNIQDVTPEVAEENDLEEIDGALIVNVNENSAAQEAGIEEGDVIKKINGVDIKNVAELQEQVARYSPGDDVEVTYIRDGKIQTTTATLKNTMYDTGIVQKENTAAIGGALLAPLSEEESEKLGVDYGVKIKEVKEGAFRRAGVKEGFVITKIAEQPVENVEEVIALLNTLRGRGGILIEGIYPGGEKAYYGLGW